MMEGTIRKCEYCKRVFILDEKSNLFIEQPHQYTSDTLIQQPQYNQTPPLISHTSSSHSSHTPFQISPPLIQIPPSNNTTFQQPIPLSPSYIQQKQQSEPLSEPLHPTDQQTVSGRRDISLSLSQEPPFDLNNNNQSKKNEHYFSSSYDNKKQGYRPLNEEEMIRAKIFEGKCPSCDYYSKKMESGERRECEKCKKIWRLNKETCFFYEDEETNTPSSVMYKNDEVNMDHYQKLHNHICPKCDLSFTNETIYDEMMRCSKCENIYKLNCSSNKYEILSFISLQIPLKAHFEYDNLSLKYLHKYFPNIDEKQIEQLFYLYKNLLIPTVSHLKVYSLKGKRVVDKCKGYYDKCKESNHISENTRCFCQYVI
jgi:hypothetical protein